MKKGLLSLRTHALQSGVQVLDDITQGEDVKVTMKKIAVEREQKKMGKKGINRAPVVVNELSHRGDLQQLRRKE